MGCFWRILVRDVLISIVTAVVVELILDQYRKPKAQIHFHEPEKAKKRVKRTEQEATS